MSPEDKKLLQDQAVAKFVEHMCGWIKANTYCDPDGEEAYTVDSADLMSEMSRLSGIDEDQLYNWFDKVKR